MTWYTLIEGGAETIIGDRVFLGPGTKVLNSTYRLDGYYTVEHLPGGCNLIDYDSIRICDDAYIGAGCTILPGSYIGEGAVVGSNSLVKGGLNPGQFTRERPAGPSAKGYRRIRSGRNCWKRLTGQNISGKEAVI